VRRCSDARRRLVLPNSEHAAIRLDPEPGAPTGDERARKSGVEEIDRNGVIQHAAHPGGASSTSRPPRTSRRARRSSPYNAARNVRRNADPDADGKAPPGHGDHFAGIAGHSMVPFSFSSASRFHDGRSLSTPLGWRLGNAMFGSCVDAFASPPMSAKSSWSSRSRRIGRPRIPLRAGMSRRPTLFRWSATTPRPASAAWTCCAGASCPFVKVVDRHEAAAALGTPRGTQVCFQCPRPWR
jgi:hypothetical protein